MKLILVLVLLAVCQAYHFDRFDGWSDEKLRNYFNVPILRTYIPPSEPTGTTFDGRTQWPNCAWDIQDQGECGSCWSFGLSESAADRWCINNGQTKVELSPQDAVSCDTSDYGCNGGYMDRSNDYLVNTGIVTRACFPYVSGGGSVPACPNKCEDSEDWDSVKHKASSYTHVTGGTSAIASAIEEGPCDVAFIVYEDFYNYYDGVYVWDGSSYEVGGHAVKMLGYGHDDSSDLDYWICANSWGTSWAGLKGFFWIVKGDNEHSGKIESNVFCSSW
jgi:cathepsin B